MGSFPAAANSNTISNNIEIRALAVIFENGTPANARYRLNASSPAKDAGSDGTDMGIYGSSLPAKELRTPAAVPVVTDFAIGGVSTPDGVLKTNIKVEAQE